MFIPGKMGPRSTGFQMALTQIITRVYKDSLILTYPPIYPELIGISILMPKGRFFHTIIGVGVETMHSPIY